MFIIFFFSKKGTVFYGRNVTLLKFGIINKLKNIVIIVTRHKRRICEKCYFCQHSHIDQTLKVFWTV